MLDEKLNVKEKETRIQAKVKSEWNKNFYYLLTIILISVLIISLGAITYYNKRKESLQKLENFFNTPEYKPIISVHTSIIQKIDFVFNNFLLPNITNSTLRRLYSTELENIDSIQKELPEFKSDSEKIKKIIENGFCSVIDKIIDYPIFKISSNIIKEYINKTKINNLNINTLEDIIESIKNDWEIIKGLYDFLPKDSIIRSFMIDYISKYSSLAFSFVDAGITIYDTVMKIDAVKEIIKKDYYNQINEIKNKFLNHTKQIKNTLNKIKEDSTREEIKKIIKNIKLIKKKIIKDQNNIKVLINDIKQQIEKNESGKNRSFLKAVGSTVASILSIGAAFAANPVIGILGAIICGVNAYAECKNMNDYNNVLEYLDDVLKISQKILDSINKSIENIDIIISEFEDKRLEITSNKYYLYSKKIICLIGLVILV